MSPRIRYLLSAFVLLAAGSRLVGLDTHPPGFFRDEADKGYTSYLLLKTGKDAAGKPYPLFARSLRVTTSALYQYVDIPFVAFFGLEERAVRLPAALAGCGAVLAVFLLARRWWGSAIGLFAAGFLAVSPWHLLLSRWANQSIFLTLWIPLGVLWFDCFLESAHVWKKLAFGSLSALAFALALYTYAPARLFVPLFVAALVGLSAYYDRSFAKRAWLLLPVLLICVSAIPLARHLLLESDESSRRFQAISIFGAASGWETVWLFVKNYLAHFSPRFLFLGGDANPRHSVGFPGQIQLYLAPLLVIGIWRCVRHSGYRERLLLIWLLLFPVPAACTNEGIPHALRSVFGLPVFQIISAIGIQELKDRVWVNWPRERIKLAAGLWTFCTGFLVLFFFYICFMLYPLASQQYWEYGYRDAVRWRFDHQQEFPRAILTGLSEYPEVFFLFYGTADPETWIKTHEIPGVEFLQTGQTMENRYRADEKGTAYLVRPGELPGVVPKYVVHLYGGGMNPIWIWVGQPMTISPANE
ncbi:MAG: glycosyltransferase family 39 protein [bacterium]